MSNSLRCVFILYTNTILVFNPLQCFNISTLFHDGFLSIGLFRWHKMADNGCCSGRLTALLVTCVCQAWPAMGRRWRRCRRSCRRCVPPKRSWAPWRTSSRRSSTSSRPRWTACRRTKVNLRAKARSPLRHSRGRVSGRGTRGSGARIWSCFLRVTSYFRSSRNFSVNIFCRNFKINICLKRLTS